MRFAFLVLLAALVLACGPSKSTLTGPGAEGLPPYTAADVPLFDDGVSPDVVGAEIDRNEPTQSRARAADGIAKVRFVTVTRDSTGEAERYALEVAPIAAPTKGEALPGIVALTLEASHPSYGLIRGADSALVGVTVVMFYKRFNEYGRPVVRWHIEADNERVSRAIEKARLLGEFEK